MLVKAGGGGRGEVALKEGELEQGLIRPGPEIGLMWKVGRPRPRSASLCRWCGRRRDAGIPEEDGRHGWSELKVAVTR